MDYRHFDTLFLYFADAPHLRSFFRFHSVIAVYIQFVNVFSHKVTEFLRKRVRWIDFFTKTEYNKFTESTEEDDERQICERCGQAAGKSRKDVSIMMKHKSVKGFTLVEMIVVIAIICILLAILVPSITGYVNLAKRKANLANARTIYLVTMQTLTTNDEASKAFYHYKTKNNMICGYESTEEGRAVLATTKNENGDVIHSKQLKNTVKTSQEGNYVFTVVARVDGVSHEIGGTNTRNDPHKITCGYNTWSWSNSNYQPFVEALCGELDMKANVQKSTDAYNIKMPYTLRDDGGTHPVIRWLIVYRWNEPEKVEIWAGDGYKGDTGPVYRAYPEKADII